MVSATKAKNWLFDFRFLKSRGTQASPSPGPGLGAVGEALETGEPRLVQDSGQGTLLLEVAHQFALPKFDEDVKSRVAVPDRESE